MPARLSTTPASTSFAPVAGVRPDASDPQSAAGERPPRLLDQVRAAIRVRQYSIRTEQAYVDWIKRFIRFNGKRHPRDLGAAEVERFLTHLAVGRNVAASTQNQALAAILSLYKAVLGNELPWLDNVQRAKKPQRLPVVLTVDEVRRLLAHLDGRHALKAWSIRARAAVYRVSEFRPSPE